MHADRVIGRSFHKIMRSLELAQLGSGGSARVRSHFGVDRVKGGER